MNKFILVVSGLIILLCGAVEAAETRTIGTIKAEFDGEKKTWHLLYSELDTTHSAVWVSREGGVNAAIIGGYESQDVEFSETGGMPVVSGEGSALVMSFSYTTSGVAEPQLSTAYPISVLFMARVGDYTSSRMLQDAVLQISEITVAADGTGTFSGTFSGTLPAIDSDTPSVQVTNGRFEVEAARRATPR